jgi:hypothetical protein
MTKAKEAEKPTGNALTPEQQEDIAFARVMRQGMKDKSIMTITSNAQNKFTKEQLQAMSLDMLQNLAVLATPPQGTAKAEAMFVRPSYFGATGASPTGNQDAEGDDDLLLPPTINYQQEAAARAESVKTKTA